MRISDWSSDVCSSDLAELPLQDLIRDGTDRVNATEVTQPLMFALQVGLARLWAQWGITPDVVMGHSLGDYAAAVAAGALEFTDAARLVAARGRLMRTEKRREGKECVRTCRSRW